MLNKVFIRGNPDYGEHIIKYLCNLGGRNRYNTKGKDKNKVYYMNFYNKYIQNHFYAPSDYKEIKIEDILNNKKNWWW